jgi:hypothetical protein
MFNKIRTVIYYVNGPEKAREWYVVLIANNFIEE